MGHKSFLFSLYFFSFHLYIQKKLCYLKIQKIVVILFVVEQTQLKLYNIYPSVVSQIWSKLVTSLNSPQNKLKEAQ